MKRSGIILFILLLALSLPLVETYGQKTSKIEKLLEYLVTDQTDKFQKNWVKLDEQTREYYFQEVALTRALYDLWVSNKEEAIIPYFTYYHLGQTNFFAEICAKDNIDMEQIRNRSNTLILELLTDSEDKLQLSSQMIDSIEGTQYPMDQQELASIHSIREEAMQAAIMKQPSLSACEVYLKEYPQGKSLFQVMNLYDGMLFQGLQKTPTQENFQLYFENTAANTFFGGPENRKSLSDARKLYDDHLYQSILKTQELPSLKAGIDTYRTTKYLTPTDRKYLAALEYKADSVDYEVLKTQVTGADKLDLIKEFLLTHRFREFRDKTNDLRASFEEHVIHQSPNTMYAYNKGKLMKSTETLPDKTVSNTYTYDGKGILKQVDTTVNEAGVESLFTTHYTLDLNGKCVLENKVQPQDGKELYRRASIYAPTGVIKADTVRYEDGRLLLRNYNDGGYVMNEQEYSNGKLLKSAAYEYDARGRKVRALFAFSMPDGLQPTYVVAQTESYEYDAYGYLKQRLIEQQLTNNAKLHSVLTYLYDAYGHSIDTHSFYEYDHTGRWIRKTDADNLANVEYVQCIYK